MAIAHGWPKLMKLTAGDYGFPDPLGVGNGLSLGLAVFGEFVCGILIAVGFFTRLSAIPYLITMLVAAFIQHGSDPYSDKSAALMYAVAAVVILLTGPGKYSLDYQLFVRKGN